MQLSQQTLGLSAQALFALIFLVPSIRLNPELKGLRIVLFGMLVSGTRYLWPGMPGSIQNGASLFSLGCSITAMRIMSRQASARLKGELVR